MNIHAIRAAPEAVIDKDGVYRQIVFVTLSDEDGIPEGCRITLRRTDGNGEEAKSVTHAVREGEETRFGFWIPVDEAEVGQEIPVGVDVELARGVQGAAGKFKVPKRVRFPLRLDRMGEMLRKRIQESAWTGDCFAGSRFRPDVEAYLSQHDVVYRRPVDHWQDGLLVGNGDFGGMITGGDDFRFWMQKTDLWATDDRGVGTGRCWGGLLRIDMGRPFNPEADRFEDRLSLYEGRVERNWSGDGWEARIAGYVHADRNLARIRCHLRSDGPVSPRISLERAAHKFPATGTSSSIGYGGEDREIWMEHVLPNMTYAISTIVKSSEAQVGHENLADRNGRSLKLPSSRSFDFEVLVSIGTDRECGTPLTRARDMTAEGASVDPEADLSTHRDRWGEYWNASFVELQDKFIEHAYYFGMYQQACVSRSEQATSFMGLSYMKDNPPWMDGYTTDAQVPVIWWSIYPSNRLDLGYPYVRTFLEMIPEFIEHSPHGGMEVAYQTLPLWAGGHRWLATVYPNPHKSSTPWFHLNFWQHYKLTGDAAFLRDYLYPLMASSARYGESVMTEGEDGRVHVVDSQSPEQSGSKLDPAIDRAMFGSLLDHLIEAGEALGEQDENRTWREMRERLFDYPQDDKSVHESQKLGHPYRCHPSVFSGVYPVCEVTPDHPLYEKFLKSLEITTDLIAYRGVARHEAFPGFDGGFEPVGFTSGWLPIVASRLDLPDLSRNLFYSPFLRFCLKPNGQVALADLRQGEWEIGRLSIVEGTNVLCACVHEWLLQVRHGVVHLFPGALPGEPMRFTNFRIEGGFLLSSERRGDHVAYFSIRGTHDGTCRVANPWGRKRVRVESLTQDNVSEMTGEVLSIETREGEIYGVTPSGTAWDDIDHQELSGERMSGPRIAASSEVQRYGKGQNFYPWLRGAGQIVRDGNLYIGMPEPSSDLPTDPMASLDSSTNRWQWEVDPEFSVDHETLMENLGSGEWKVRQDALRRMGAFSSPDLTRIQSMLDDPHPIVRRTAQASLARSGEQKAGDLLARVALLGTDPGDRAEALRFLRLMEDEVVLKAVRDKGLVGEVEGKS